MPNTKLFKFTSILLFIVATLYFLENILYLSWTIWWYDMLLHVLAGIVVGTTTLLILQKIFDRRLPSGFNITLIAIISVFCVGILWEIFELHFNLTSFSLASVYITDTTSDLILDMVGAFFGVFYGLKTWSS